MTLFMFRSCPAVSDQCPTKLPLSVGLCPPVFTLAHHIAHIGYSLKERIDAEVIMDVHVVPVSKGETLYISLLRRNISRNLYLLIAIKNI